MTDLSSAARIGMVTGAASLLGGGAALLGGVSARSAARGVIVAGLAVLVATLPFACRARRHGERRAGPEARPLTPFSVWLHRLGLVVCLATTLLGVPVAVMVAVTLAVFASLPGGHRRQVIAVSGRLQ